tara:strand:+ start:112 stop:1011 length:900 start_codon:yes stop_codon:yes gene_type:complete
MSLLSFFSCSTYKIADNHISKKMESASMQCQRRVIKGDTVEYWDSQTDKPALMLIHGFGATTRFQWFKQVEMLSEHYRVILPNLLHFGNSFPSEEKFSLENQVELVSNLANDLLLDKFILGGVSYGGIVSIEYANKNPHRVEKLIILDSPIKFMFASDIKNVCKTFKVSSVEELFAPSNAKGLKKLWHLSSSRRSILPAFMFKEFHEKMYVGDLANKRTLMRSLVNDLNKYAKHEYSLEMPILLVWGSNDMVVPAERGKMLHDYLGENSEFHVIFKGGHMVNLNKTKEFNKILGEFLAK